MELNHTLAAACRGAGVPVCDTTALLSSSPRHQGVPPVGPTGAVEGGAVLLGLAHVHFAVIEHTRIVRVHTQRIQ